MLKKSPPPKEISLISLLPFPAFPFLFLFSLPSLFLSLEPSPSFFFPFPFIVCVRFEGYTWPKNVIFFLIDTLLPLLSLSHSRTLRFFIFFTNFESKEISPSFGVLPSPLPLSWAGQKRNLWMIPANRLNILAKKHKSKIILYHY